MIPAKVWVVKEQIISKLLHWKVIHEPFLNMRILKIFENDGMVVAFLNSNTLLNDTVNILGYCLDYEDISKSLY